MTEHTNVLIHLEEEGIVSILPTNQPPKVGGYVKYKNKIRIVIAINRTTLVIERNSLVFGKYQEVPKDQCIPINYCAVNTHGVLIGKIIDKESTGLTVGAKVSGQKKSKLSPLIPGMQVRIVNVNSASPIFWAKNQIGKVFSCDHPIYIVELDKSITAKVDRNQLRTVSGVNEDICFVNIKILRK